MIWYRSAAVAGAVYVNELGKTERLSVEAILYTFGKGAKDAARAGALVAVAQYVAEQEIEAAGLRVIRVWTIGETVFEVVAPDEAKGLGAYRLGIRIEDETVRKIDVRYRRSVGAVVGEVVEQIGEFIGFLRRRLFG